MKLTILGCSGSVPVPGNAASGYLVSSEGNPSLVMDLGPGTLAQLQTYQDPCNAHMLFTHLHADHCLDFPSLMVWRRFHPTAPAADKHECRGPQATVEHLGRLSADELPHGIDDMGDTFNFAPWSHGQPQGIGPATVTPFAAIHPVETYALRVDNPATGNAIAYSADSAYTEELIPAAQGAKVFLCEAGWGPSSEGKAPNMHMSGAEAGRLARQAQVETLVLVHLPPWADAQATLQAAQAEFPGTVVLGAPGMEFEF